MATIDTAEPLAGDLLTRADAPLTSGLVAQADGIFARFDSFGVAALDPAGALNDALIGRWSLPEHLENGLELFELDMLGELGRAWASRVGYFDAQFDFDSPFVVPVDPEQPVPVDAAHVRRSRQRRPARAMRPVAPGGARPLRPVATALADRLAERWAEPAEGPAASPGALDAALVEPTADPRPMERAHERGDASRAERVSSSAARTAATAADPAVAPGTARSSTPSPDDAVQVAARRPAASARPSASPPSASSPSASPGAATATPAAPGASVSSVHPRPGAVEAPTPSSPARPLSTLARQRWRASGERGLTPYPRAMGRAGTIDAGLLRFPEARARIGGARPAILGGTPAVDLMPARGGLTPVGRGAERMVQRLVDALVPVPEPVTAWLMPLAALAAPGSVQDGGLPAGSLSPAESALAMRAPSAELVRPTPLEVAAARTTAPSRPRLDGRVPLTARSAAPARSAGRDRPLDGSASSPGLGEVLAARSDTTPGLIDAERPVTASRPIAPPAAVAASRADTVGGPGQASRRPPSATAPSEPFAPLQPLSGARAWLRDVFEPQPTAPEAAPGRPGTLASAARWLAERVAVTAGEPPLLAHPRSTVRPLWLPDAATTTLVEPRGPMGGGAATPRAITASRVAVDRPSAAPPASPAHIEPRAPARGVSPGQQSLPEPGLSGALVGPSRVEGSQSATAEVDAGRADAGPVEAARADDGRADDPRADAAVDAPSTRLPARAIAPADAAAWAARIVQRLGGGPESGGARPMQAIVERIAERLVGGTLLAETLGRLEAADAPEARSRAWRSVVDATGLDPELAALVHPVADRPAVSAADAAPSGRRPETAAQGPQTPPAAAVRRGPAGHPGGRPIASGMQPRGAAETGRAGADATRDRAPARAAVRRIEAPRAATPEAFERRMGLSDLTRPITPIEGRRWVLDPAGQRWLVPLADRAASTPSTESTPRAPVAAEPLASAGLASSTAALAERIVASFLPDSPPAMARAAAQVLTRLSPAAAEAWVVGGFDPLVLPAAERALVQSAVAPARPSARGAAARTGSGARPTPETATAGTPGLSRPGALGAAMARLAERVVERPTMATRGGARPAVVTPGDVPAGGAAVAGSAGPAGPTGARPGSPSRPAHSMARALRPSSMDPAALIAAGASATEARMPARLRQWASIGDAPPPAPARGDFGAAPTPVMVQPGGATEEVAAQSAAADPPSLPGSRTVAAALRAFDRARAGNGSKAPAVGRAPISAADVGQLVAAAMTGSSLGGRLFGDRGPLAVTPPGAAGRVHIETGRRPAGEQPLRSTGESAGPRAETNDDARHRLANQTEGDLSPEELEKIADEVIAQLRRELEFEGSRFGGDEWD